MAQSNSTSKPIQLFYSYSHQDEKLRDELEKHLSPLKWQGIISGWYDRRIGAGTEWSKEIERYLEESQVILLLISADFLASDYCYGREMRRALEKHATGEARVIPILLRPVDWSTTPLAQLQAVPQDAKPVTTWSNRDTAWASVAKSIRLVCEEVQKDYFMNFSKSDSIKNNSVETSQSIKYSSSTKNKNIIKYFTYISDTKLDMFWTQIPRNILENIASNLKIDLTGIEISSKSKASETTRYSKVAIITDYIMNNFEVGTVEKPQTYFMDTLDITTGIIKDGKNAYVYFGGSTKQRAVALVGSPRHILGQTKKWQETYSRGFSAYLMPYIISAFSASVQGELVPKEDASEETNHDFAYYVHWINQDISGPVQRLEFLARRLSQSSDAVLGTPIYVALAD